MTALKVIIAKDVDSLRIVGRQKVYESYLAGYWDGDKCVIVKDRAFGHNNLRLSADELVDYIAKSEKHFK